MMRHILWIEDAANDDLAVLAAPVYMDGGFLLSVAVDATEGMERIMEKSFDVVIFDIRIPPGSDQRWIKLYERVGSNKIDAQLGLHLLRTAIGHESAEIPLEDESKKVDLNRTAVLTVEPFLGEELRRLGIFEYYVKASDRSDVVLLDIANEVLNANENK